MNETVANIAVIAATVGTVTFLIPQIVKLIRTRDSAGVSEVWAALGFVTNVGWLSYVVANRFWAAIVAPTTTFIAYGVALWALRRAGVSIGRAVRDASVWAIALVAVALIGGWATLGVVLGLSYAVILAPSVWRAYRSADPSGIAPGTWAIGIAEAFLWGYYGAFNRDAGIVLFGITGVLGSSLILARYLVTRRRAVPVA